MLKTCDLFRKQNLNLVFDVVLLKNKSKYKIFALQPFFQKRKLINARLPYLRFYVSRVIYIFKLNEMQSLREQIFLSKSSVNI